MDITNLSKKKVASPKKPKLSTAAKILAAFDIAPEGATDEESGISDANILSIEHTDQDDQGHTVGVRGTLEQASRSMLEELRSLLSKLRPSTLMDTYATLDEGVRTWTVVGDLQRGWAVSVIAYTGEYCDDDYDASGSFEMITGSPESAADLVRATRADFASCAAAQFYNHVTQYAATDLPGESEHDRFVALWDQLAQHADAPPFCSSVRAQLTGDSLEKNTPSPQQAAAKKARGPRL